MASVKRTARDVIERLPETAGWDEVMYELYVAQKVERGLAEIEAGQAVPHEEAKRRLLTRT